MITIQTVVPELVLKKRSSSCSFSGFENPHGINFSACILQELHSDIPRRRESELQTLLEFFKKSIQKYYDIYQNNAHIRELFKVKHQYKKTMKKNRIHFQENKAYDVYPFDEPPKSIDSDSFKQALQIHSSGRGAGTPENRTYQLALFSDLRETGTGCLPANISGFENRLVQGKFVLQVYFWNCAALKATRKMSVPWHGC